MVKLSAELIEQAAQYTNPVRDRELDLRDFSFSNSRIGEALEHSLPSLKELVLTNNNIQELNAIASATSLAEVERLKGLLQSGPSGVEEEEEEEENEEEVEQQMETVVQMEEESAAGEVEGGGEDEEEEAEGGEEEEDEEDDDEEEEEEEEEEEMEEDTPVNGSA
ncbi:hypothetical protein JZ751_020701 [Albula glossodonta]|uniref:Uncharacterized protein n=1 Tax=Albula glossodonta TaxID=121402 RepID=A0A8T2PNE2_9TELE|nr:hypothetical protein JZ751_020701 [Albula glossodonta]